MGTITAEVIDTGERRDARGRRVFPSVRRLELVRAFRASGVSMAKFARREGINYTTFAGWMQRKDAVTTTRPVRFAEVRLPALRSPGESLEVRLPDGTVVSGSRVSEVITLVRALRS